MGSIHFQHKKTFFKELVRLNFQILQFYSGLKFNLNTVNDVDSFLTNTNDSILTHILLFGKASLDTSANTLLFNAKWIILYQRTDLKKVFFSFFFVYFCYIFTSLTFFAYPKSENEFFFFFCDYIFIFI